MIPPRWLFQTSTDQSYDSTPIQTASSAAEVDDFYDAAPEYNLEGALGKSTVTS